MPDGPTTGEASAGDTHSGGTQAAHPRVILLDDHELVLEGLSRTLQRGGMDVVAQCLTGEQAIAALTAHAVDLLIVDLRLHEASGVDVIDRARRLSPDTEVAVLTSFEDADAAAKAMRSGAKGFLLKDTPSSELVARLRGVTEGNLIYDGRITEALAEPPAPVLSEQEIQILQAVAEGLTNREIGARLHLSHYTIKDYLTRAMRKLGTSRRAEAVTKAAKQGLLDDAS